MSKLSNEEKNTVLGQFAEVMANEGVRPANPEKKSDSFPVGPTLDAIVSKSKAMISIEFADMPSPELQMELNELYEKVSPYADMGEEPWQGKSFYLALPSVYCPSRTAEGIAKHLEKQYKMRVQRRELKQPAISKEYEPTVVKDFAKAAELKEMRRDAIREAIRSIL